MTSVTVVEKITAEAPGSVTEIEDQELQRIPGVNIDDRLRMVPGFSLFRRSSSVVANPTTQGVSLRGVGSTGASRTLVLRDGIPLNDPFGGWVYWTRVSADQVDRVEVSRGASTSVFGDRAMSGVVALFSREPERHRLQASYEAGNRDTHNLSAGYSNLWGNFATTFQARAFTTDGYYIISEADRGPVDTKANLRFAGGDTKLDWLRGRDRLSFQFDVLAEERDNGTVLQYNSTSLGMIGASYSREWNRDSMSAYAYHMRQEFRASFSSITADRTSERLTLLQTVPAEATGGAAMVRHSGSRWRGVFGGDFQRVEGYSKEQVFPSGSRVGGGDLLQHGVFGQADFSAGPAKLFLGARHHFTGQDSRFFSPSAGITAGRGPWRARGSVYRSFRAPTLNELYREFRVGNAVTLANPNLKPEALFGAEAGIDYVGESRRAGVTFYRNELTDLITNVTLSVAPNLITRQRQNASAALARGVEVDVRQRWRSWQFDAGYLFADSRFATGERLPQIPKHQGSAQLTFMGHNTIAAAGFRSNGAQFEDDLNSFVLPGFAVAHFSMRQRIASNVWAQFAIENLFDREYVVGQSPTALIGAPRLWRVGLRWDGRLR